MCGFLYVNSDTQNGPARATALGCGWFPQVPAEFASIATAPCAIVSGAGTTVVLEEPTTAQAVSDAAAPILAAEQAAAQTAATQAANAASLLQKAANALTTNATFLGLGSPTNAQTLAQVQALTRQIDALIRIAANQLDSTSGT